jgi:transcriptional regulator with XRE-family HTH domain
MRRRANQGQAEFARLQGWPQASLSQYESGDALPNTERLIALLRFAATARERGPILRALETRGVTTSDLAGAPPTSPEQTPDVNINETLMSEYAGDNLDRKRDSHRAPMETGLRSEPGTQRGNGLTTSIGAAALGCMERRNG